MRFRTVVFEILLIGMTAVASSCSPTRQAFLSTPEPDAALTPYVTRTPVATLRPGEVQTATPVPAPTPTPVTHVVLRGEDMGGIAYTYKVTLKALMDANPGVSPNAMSVGTVLVIPISGQPVAIIEENKPPPDGTIFGEPICYQTGEGGLQCFSLVKNQTNSYIGNIKAVFHLVNPGGGSVDQAGFSLLDIVPPEGSSALIGYFPPKVQSGYSVSMDQNSAAKISNKTAELVKLKIEDQRIVSRSDELSVEINGKLSLTAPEKEDFRIQVAGIALDTDGMIVGGRRWEAKGTGENQSLPFAFRVYSEGGKIAETLIFASIVP